MQYGKLMFLLSLVLGWLSFVGPAFAITDPLSTPNNKFGIHIISATSDESSPAANLVNSSGGDWGYVTALVESKDRNRDKWQSFFNDLRRRHLIPIVRLATQPEGNFWKLPYEGEETAWADFLDNLTWPVKNRYVVIYNEPNQGQEWAGKADPRSYARVLDKTISALKNKNPDFFVLNAGFDASAPSKLPQFWDEVDYLKQMDQEVPGIFNKLDGWVSHSYPNPGFAGSPNGTGRGTVRTWAWELQLLKGLGLNKNLPVFITETGWKHAEGIDLDKSLPATDTLSQYFKTAFEEAWNSRQIVAVTPFLLNYQEPPFDHFSFKKITGEKQNQKILGASFPDYYPHYQALLDLPKQSGKPLQENKAEVIGGFIYTSIVAGESYISTVTLKNAGQSIWNESVPFQVKALGGQKELGIEFLPFPAQKVEPGQEATIDFKFKAPQSGAYEVTLQLLSGNKPFDQEPFTFTTAVKSSPLLLVKAKLPWKKSSVGDYLLSISSDFFQETLSVKLNNEGLSPSWEVRNLLPDHNYTFTLSKPLYKQSLKSELTNSLYKPQVLKQRISSGLNELNFGALEINFGELLKAPWSIGQLLF